MGTKICDVNTPKLSWKGFRGKARNCVRLGTQRMQKALQYSFRDRRNRKRDMRALWIQRVNATTTHQHGCTFGTFMHGLLKENILLNRKVLSQLSVQEPNTFKTLVDVSCSGLSEGESSELVT